MGTGFRFDGVSARDYDDLRPGYAPQAVAWIRDRAGLGAGSRVVDLAAGTGQLARQLVPLRLDVVAVEPAANMRTILRERLPSIRVTAGRAEAIPLADGSADAVVVGNAFHHFDADRAFAEIARVLRPGGTLALLWARSGEPPLPDPALQEIEEAVERARVETPYVAAFLRWFEPPRPVRGFPEVERRTFDTTHTLPSARLADLYATSSDVASIPDDARTELLDRIRELSRTLPPTLVLPSTSVVDRFRRT